jgi:hypothetical protein
VTAVETPGTVLRNWWTTELRPGDRIEVVSPDAFSARSMETGAVSAFFWRDVADKWDWQ